jgi:hypothetical protein
MLSTEATAREEHLLVVDLVASYGVIIVRTVWGAGRHQRRGAATHSEHESFTNPVRLEQRIAELLREIWPRGEVIAGPTPVPAPRAAA